MFDVVRSHSHLAAARLSAMIVTSSVLEWGGGDCENSIIFGATYFVVHDKLSRVLPTTCPECHGDSMCTYT